MADENVSARLRNLRRYGVEGHLRLDVDARDILAAKAERVERERGDLLAFAQSVRDSINPLFHLNEEDLKTKAAAVCARSGGG